METNNMRKENGYSVGCQKDPETNEVLLSQNYKQTEFVTYRNGFLK